jgi:hypothetical protein
VKRESRIVLLVSIHLAVVAACAVIGMHLMQPVTGTNPGPQPFLDRLERSAAGSAVAAEAGLLALWAAYGRQRQLWRLLGVTAGDALLALVRVPSLDHGLLRRVFSSLALITVLILVIIKTILFFVRSSDREREERAGTRRFHFSIVQLLSATAGTAVVAYLVRVLFYRDQSFARLMAVAITLAADWATRADCHRRQRAGAVLALACAISAFDALSLFGPLRLGELFGPVATIMSEELLQLWAGSQVAYCTQAAILVTTLWIVRSPRFNLRSG